MSSSISGNSGSGRTFTLKFISGKYQGGEFPLKPERQQVVIGRSSELDMVLVEDMVSRKHAKITVTPGKVMIEDLGSTNGTFVNGEKIKQARLKEGDRILIGTSILKVMHSGAAAASMDETQVKRNLEEAAEKAAKKSSSMTGKIEEIPLPDLLQLFQTSKKNGVLIVRSDREGRIYMRQGRVYYAVIDDNHALGPGKSFNRIVTWERGDFELGPPDATQFATELDSPTEALLMDALRQLDEFRRLANELPALSATLTLANPMTAQLRDLTAEELDVLQLVHNYGSLQSVMDLTDKDDLVTAESVSRLIQRGYIQPQS